jgi:putative SOS response-associated peptidase YedK
MCGRFALTITPARLRAQFALGEVPSFPPRFNIAPTQPVAIVRAQANTGANELVLMRWGFLPQFARNPKEFPLLFNARSEGIDQKASFRNALKRRRCLVPADAFYEWRRSGTGRGAQSQPYLARRVDGRTMGLAGLYETWLGPNGEEVDTVCIITTGANGLSVAIHPRLPVVLEPKDFAAWLDPDEAAATAAMRLLRTPADDVLTFAPVSDAINAARNDGPDLQAPTGSPLMATPDAPDEADAVRAPDGPVQLPLF